MLHDIAAILAFAIDISSIEIEMALFIACLVLVSYTNQI